MRAPGLVVQNTNRFTQAVRKLLSIKGEERDVSFGVHLEDERPEFSFIKQERLWAQYNEVTSAAGTLPVIGVSNPVNSGVLAVVTNVFADSSVAQRYNLGIAFGLVQAQGGAGLWARDTRWAIGPGTIPQPTTIRAIAVAVAAGGPSAIFTSMPHAVDVVQDYMVNVGRVPPIVLSPGNQLYLFAAAVGVATLRATFAGYERPLESGELQA